MLTRVGRWLRAAGYDTMIIDQPLEDRAILELAIKENRLLVTRDKHFLTMHQSERWVIYLHANSLKECIKELSLQIEIDWMQSPFSRCLLCNHLLTPPTESDINQQVPADVRAISNQFTYCAHCHKVYWNGTHSKRMLKQLHEWHEKYMSR